MEKWKVFGKCMAVFMSLILIAGVSSTVASDKLKVAAIIPGHINDGSFNQSGYEGLLLIEKELGAEVSYVEKVPDAYKEENIIDYARRGYDLIFAMGGEMDSAVIKAGKKFPKSKFLVVNGVASAPNIACGGLNKDHYGFVSGFLAGKMTKSNKISFIAGTKFPFVNSLFEIFKKGALNANPEANANIVFTGDWDDVPKAKEAAFAQIANGVDVIFPFLDLATLGIIDAARERDIYVFGDSFAADSVETKQQLEIAPKHILGQVLYNYAGAMLHIAKLVKEDQFEGGSFYYLGLETPDITGLVNLNKSIPQDVRKAVDGITENIIAGKISF